MKQNRLGNSGIVVSDICLGTMTFGSQCDKEQSFRILDKAVDAGIDFLDTAEVYPVPPNREWAGLTEQWLGEWLKTKDGQCCEYIGEDVQSEKHFGKGAGIALRQGEDELKGAFNKALAEIIADGTYKKINDKYFPFSIY